MKKETHNAIVIVSILGLIFCVYSLGLQAYKYGRYEMCNELNGQIYQGGYTGNKLGVCYWDNYEDAIITITPQHLTREGYSEMVRPKYDSLFDLGDLNETS